MGKGFYSRREIEGIVNKIRSPSLPFGAGKVFFVNCIDGSDSNPGDDPARPLKTIGYALGLCQARRDDYIICLKNQVTSVETFPIVIDKHQVHIIGLGGMGAPIDLLAADAPVFQFAGEDGYNARCELAGFTLGASGGYPCIDVLKTTVYAHLHDLQLGEGHVAQDGIMGNDIAGSELVWSRIERCLFGKELTRDGIRTGVNAGSLTFCHILDNVFSRYGGIGINNRVVAAAVGGTILRNKFFQKIGGDKGCAITIVAAQNWMIDDNHAMEDAAEPGNNPYLDTTTGDLTTTKNAWGLNYKGLTATFPAVA